MSEYEIRESTRAKHLRITVHTDGKVIITKPLRISEAKVRTFVTHHTEWIQQMQTRMRRSHERAQKKHGTPLQLPRLRRGTAAYREAVSKARALVQERVGHFSTLGAFTHGTISIRNQKTRWGSCSAGNNLSFNYRLIYLPDTVLDYLIVHELAHTREHNHSKAFWGEVGKLITEYQKRRNELHRFRW